MEMHDAMRLIAGKSPTAMHAAMGALRALANNSPVAQSRAQRTLEAALADIGADFTAEERSGLALLLTGQPEGPRTLDLRIRVSEAEKADVQQLAADAGLSLSNFVRRAVGLPLVD